jgi:hypothetical protein
MSQRELILLSPYRMPAQTSMSLGNEDVASILNGYLSLWHPTAIVGASGPPKLASPYDHEQPTAGHVYAVPEHPPLILPDDWDQRVSAAGAVAFRATPERDRSLTNLTAALGSESPLRDLPREQVAPFLGIGFGYLMVDTLFEAMEHENLLATADVWREVQAAVAAVGTSADTVRQHLQAAADLLKSAREVLYPVAIHIVDIGVLDGNRLDQPWPASFKDQAVNLVASAALLEKLQREQPERFAALKEKFQAEAVEICSGVYLEREDTLLPVESQLWNLLKGTRVFRELLGSDVRVFGRRRFGASPQLPLWLNNVGINRALLLAFDASVLPNWKATVTSWPSPDGKQIEAFTRSPYAADSPQTFFNMAHYLQRTIRQDQTATIALLHNGPAAAPYYDDWLELSRFGPVIGQWSPLSRYFSESMTGEYAAAANADDFHSDYLEERTNAHSLEPVSGFARHAQLRRRFDTITTLAAFLRGLIGKNDPLNLDVRLTVLEDRLETGADVEAVMNELHNLVGETLAGRLVARAPAERPGFLVLNPCSFTRRLALELDGMSGQLPVEGPIKAFQLDPDKGRLVVEVPALGFAWFPKSGNASPPAPGKIKLADKNGVRNEFFEAEVDPLTGGLRALRDHRTRLNRVGQQVVYNPGSTMRATEVKVTSAGTALGEVVSTGTILDEHQQVIAAFRQRFRAWLGRPVLELRIEITPETPPTGYPWHCYYGARFACREERATLLRGVNGVGYVSNHTRPESPDYVELRVGKSNTIVFTGGLPFMQRHGGRMLDVILLAEGDRARSFDLLLGLDREHPMQTALGMVTTPAVIPTAKGPPHIGAAGWLYHLDATNLLLTSMRPGPEGEDALLLRMLECSVHGGQAEFRCVRNPNRAVLLDTRGGTLMEAGISGDAATFETAPCDLVQLRVDFS